MNVVGRTYDRWVKQLEEKGLADQTYRLRYHVQPPVGWLNDPNGLSQFHGLYHFFFQYAPFGVDGSDVKFWGHATSRDMIHWDYHDVAIYADSPQDIHGVFSGGAFVEDGKLELFFTGNVKLAGDYDFITAGREGNTLYMASDDGFHFGHKSCLLHAGEYPAQYSCHIRDPKVWKEDGRYWMLLGARSRDDRGAVLVYRSPDKKQWQLIREVTGNRSFGYMWECPDLIRLDGERFLSMSPQGVGHQSHRFQNVYASGYLPFTDGELDVDRFEEWDYGFDFYAPQSFVDEAGRTILVGWAGLPDIEYTNPTTQLGWQHCLTTPRQLSLHDGKICQWPVEEFERLRKTRQVLEDELTIDQATFDLEIETTQGDFTLTINELIELRFSDGLLTLSLDDRAGYGRGQRFCECDRIETLRLLADTSLLEIYVNGGEKVLTTRFYIAETQRRIKLTGAVREAVLWEI
ncbi:MAG: glycoside hydrolase family 32 protein [Eubacteriales bacterium]|nr:glycoside hydrolase family 32 protein [Eubacteriales bacterium]